MSAVAIKALILTIKTVSKPVSKRLKAHASASERFRGLCIAIGRFMNRSTHSINVRLAGGKKLKMKPLGEQEAVSRGAEVVGEGFVYGTSVLLLVGEYARRDYIKDLESAEKARAKRVRRREKDALLEAKFAALRREIDVLQTEVRELKENSKSITSKIRAAIVPSLGSPEDAAAEGSHAPDEQKTVASTSWFDGSWLAALSPFYFRREEEQEDETSVRAANTAAGALHAADSDTITVHAADDNANTTALRGDASGVGGGANSLPPNKQQHDADEQLRLLKKIP